MFCMKAFNNEFDPVGNIFIYYNLIIYKKKQKNISKKSFSKFSLIFSNSFRTIILKIFLLNYFLKIISLVTILKL